jgi:mannose-1-phosphate guanylyltransferase
MPIKTAVILAGGLGTRLRPLTYEMPKALIPIRGTTLTEHVIAKLKEAGVKKVYLSIGHMADRIIEYFKTKDQGVEIGYIIEKEPLGTGGWLHLITPEQRKLDFSEDFIVVNGDNLFDLDWAKMHKLHTENDALITIGLSVVQDVSAYGVAELSGKRIVRFVEKPKAEDAPSNYINSGYYIFSPKIFNHLPDAKRIMFETDIFPKIAEKQQLFGYLDKSQWFDTGTFERWEEVIKRWKVK